MPRSLHYPWAPSGRLGRLSCWGTCRLESCQEGWQRLGLLGCPALTQLAAPASALNGQVYFSGAVFGLLAFKLFCLVYFFCQASCQEYRSPDSVTRQKVLSPFSLLRLACSVMHFEWRDSFSRAL